MNNDEENINSHLNRLEYEQKEQYEQLNIKINQMKDEVFKELRNIKYKPIQVNNNNNILNKTDEENKTNIDKTKSKFPK